MIVSREKLDDAVTRIVENITDDADDQIAEIDEVMVIVAVHYGSTADGDGDIGSTFYTCSSGRGFVQRGLLQEGRRAVDFSTTSVDDA